MVALMRYDAERATELLDAADADVVFRAEGGRWWAIDVRRREWRRFDEGAWRPARAPRTPIVGPPIPGVAGVSVEVQDWSPPPLAAFEPAVPESSPVDGLPQLASDPLFERPAPRAGPGAVVLLGALLVLGSALVSWTAGPVGAQNAFAISMGFVVGGGEIRRAAVSVGAVLAVTGVAGVTMSFVRGAETVTRWLAAVTFLVAIAFVGQMSREVSRGSLSATSRPDVFDVLAAGPVACVAGAILLFAGRTGRSRW